tara:strand:- start:378 stop:479 length:102 start_codon:yes stop_codon:yes gene_type:complete
MNWFFKIKKSDKGFCGLKKSKKSKNKDHDTKKL